MRDIPLGRRDKEEYPSSGAPRRAVVVNAGYNTTLLGYRGVLQV